MSTKATIAHGDDFHFYHEIFEDDFVYLELEGVDFCATRDRVTVPIPLAIWEVIRTRGGADLSLAAMSGEELRLLVGRVVDERIVDYQECLARTGDPSHARLFAGGLFGSPDAPREEQVEAALEEYTQDRDRQRALLDEITRLEARNRRRDATSEPPAPEDAPAGPKS